MDKENYEVLIPNNMIENKAEDAFEFALKNDKINNIAITGKYSSGKSSMIQSYFEKNIHKKDCLNISLATFEIKRDGEVLCQSNALEKIIIEKLYYSILKKYNKIENIKESILTGIIVLFINIAIYLFNMDSVNKSLNNNLWITGIFIALEIIFLTCLIYYLISYIMSFQKIKLKLGDLEIELNQGNNRETNRNLLNEELDFIVKTMNIAKYKYIIFEDLDRFQNPQIFERLRDLNITLNSTLKQKVKFIYAIRDEMFVADNRTKFFDFIIPVVPYVSYENSGEELLKIIKKHKLESELSEDFILDISLYISDIRILKNTINEYIIYNKTLDKLVPDYEKLFSILLYKNTCSKDFARLENKEGIVYDCFSKKDEKINECIIAKQEEIKKKHKDYEDFKRSLMCKKNLKELAIYNILKVADINNQITLTTLEGNQIIIRTNTNIDNIQDNVLFSPDTKIKCVLSGNWKTKNLTEFFEENCPELLNQYENSNKEANEIKEKFYMEIEKIKKEIDIAKEYTLSELMQEDEDKVSINLGEYSDLVKYLLANAYIDENYTTYINKFHEGSITEKDYKFLMNVRHRKQNDYKAKLNNPIKIIKRLKEIEFNKEEALNIDILTVLFENDEYVNKKNIFMNTLINSDNYIDCIKYCICESEDFKSKKKLVENLCELDKDILNKIQKANIEDKFEKLIIENIIILIDINRLESLNNIEETIEYIEKNNLLKNEKVYNIKEKIEKFNIKYYNVYEFKNNTELYKYIIENNRYNINYENILNILIKEDKGNQKEIEESNYYCIVKNEQLKEYIKEYMQVYMDNVYNKLANKQKNPIKIVVELLNNSNIKFESKKDIISKETNIIENILEIEDKKLWKDIFNNNLVQINWKNINDYYNEFGIDETLVKVFNNMEKMNPILEYCDEIENEISLTFIIDLLLSNDLCDQIYNLILKKSKCKLENAEISMLEKNRLIKLINSKKIKFNLEMFERIRLYSTEMVINFIKNNYTNVHNEIDNKNIIFTLDEINDILKSDATVSIKNKCILMIEDEKIEELENELIENIVVVILKNKIKENLSEEMLKHIVTNIKNKEKKIELINLNFNKMTQNNINEFLEILGQDYVKIILNNKKPRFNNNEYNILLLKNISELGYNIKYDVEEKIIKLRNTIR